MIRLKFLLLALAALALWVAHLFVLTPVLSRQGVDSALRNGELAAVRLQQLLSPLREAVLQAGFKLAAQPELVETIGFRRLPPNAEQLSRARAAVDAQLPESFRGRATVGLVNEAGQLWFRGDAFPRSGLDGAEGLTVLSQGPQGSLLLGRELFVFSAIPLGTNDLSKGPALVVGIPVPVMEVAMGVGGGELAALGVHSGEQPVAEVGPEKAALGPARESLKKRSLDRAVVTHGPASTLGPLQFPLFTGGEEGPPRLVAARRALDGLPLEVVALSRIQGMETLAAYQRFSLFTALGFFGLCLLAALTPNGLGESAPGMSVPQAIRGVPRTTSGSNLPSLGTPPVAAARNGPSMLGGLTLPEEPPAEASPDDFHFGHTRVTTLPTPPHEGARHDTLQNGVPEMPFDAPDTARVKDARGMDPDFVPTASYPVHKPRTDPFGQMDAEPAGGNGAYGSADFGEDNPEATRVAAIPHHLLEQSAQAHDGGSDAMSAPPVPNGPPENVGVWTMPSVPPPVDEEQQHFQDVFQEYLATRERCGEQGETLTFDRFAQKLRKNKDQLVQKYGCRTVRFQVYVKEGKAALKATPVKD